MRHIFKQGTDTSAPVLLLLHGTGGTEQDLLPIAEMIAPSSSVLSVRGNVLEHGMPRFFRRLAEGVFDIEDLIFRTQELHDFLDEAAEEHGFDRKRLVAVGYSNGANIAGSLLFHHANALLGAVLLHPMVPRREMELPDLAGTACFIGAGLNDPICTAEETEELAALLKSAGATVETHWDRMGHQLSRAEVEAAGVWFRLQYGESGLA